MALAFTSPTRLLMCDRLRAYLDEQASDLDESVRQALSITNGDVIAAPRASIIATSFLQEEIDGLNSQVSTGLTRGRVNKRGRPSSASGRKGRKVAPQFRSQRAPKLVWSGRSGTPRGMKAEMKGTKLSKENFRIK